MKKEIALSIILFLCMAWVSNSIWAMEPDGMVVELGEEFGEESSEESSFEAEGWLQEVFDPDGWQEGKEGITAEMRRRNEEYKLPELDRRLIRAVKKGNKKRVRALVEAGANVCVKKYRPHFDSRDEDYVYSFGIKLVFSPIHWAAANRPEMVALLLELGADITKGAGRRFSPPLHRAVQESNEMVQLLLLSPHGVPGVSKTKWHTMRRRLQQLLYGITYARRGKAPIPREIRPLICRFALQVDGPPNEPPNGPLIQRFPLQFLRYLCRYNLVDKEQLVTAFTQRHIGILSQLFSARDCVNRTPGAVYPPADGVDRTLFDAEPERIRAHFGENIEGAYSSFLTTFTQGE